MSNTSKADKTKPERGSRPTAITMLRLGTAMLVLLLILPWVEIPDGPYEGYHSLLISSPSVYRYIFDSEDMSFGNVLTLMASVWVPLLASVWVLIYTFLVDGKEEKPAWSSDYTYGSRHELLASAMPHRQVRAIFGSSLSTVMFTPLIVVYLFVSHTCDPTPFAFLAQVLALVLAIACPIVSRRI